VNRPVKLPSTYDDYFWRKKYLAVFFSTRTNPNGFCLHAVFFLSVTLITVSSMTIKSLTYRPNIHITAQGNSPGTTPLFPLDNAVRNLGFRIFKYIIHNILYILYVRRILGIFLLYYRKSAVLWRRRYLFFK